MYAQIKLAGPSTEGTHITQIMSTVLMLQIRM